MRIALREEADGNYSRSMAVREIDGETLDRAKEIFSEYKNRGVILAGDFDDMSWTLTNQARNVELALLTFEGGANKEAMRWLGCPYRKYIECVKAYIAFNLGEIGLATLQELTRVFNRLAGASSDEAAASAEYLSHIIALLQIMPGGNEERDYVIETLEEKHERMNWQHHKGGQRRLADFKTYLRFHEVLADFWQDAGDRQKLFYFPLYFWWNLTAILPLRPMEFLLTPRDCLQTRDGENILAVRRTKLKGGNEKISYRIAEDYELKEYAIHENLVRELRWYIGATGKMRMTELGTLLLQAPHFEYLGRKGYAANRYYTYGMLTTCLRYFYREVVLQRAADIESIHLGDTRHLAMTNLIISGGSPVICRELAGHSDVDVSAHYYANISNLVECVTIERYRKSKGATANIVGSARYPLSKPPDASRLEHGWCGSELMRDEDIGDCLKVLDGDGHIGECGHCEHYWPDDQGIRLEFYDERAGKDRVDADSRHLIRMIELVRKGLGHEEDIGSALLRLQRSGRHYGKCLWEKYSTEDKA
jgi:hypothetical protein